VSANGNAFTVRFQFHGDLDFFVRARNASEAVTKVLREKTSVKDAIESCGIPHPEIDLILVGGKSVDFSYQLEVEIKIDIFSVDVSPNLFAAHRLQRRGITKFVADGHLGKLARDLRLLGIDVSYDNVATDAQLIEIATSQDRALLTRDRRLLMHAVIQNGYCPRSDSAEEQTIKVIRRFDLAKASAPFTRCLHCNAALSRVQKQEIINKLEPLTKIYYEDFRRCTKCGQIYWAGSHFEKLQARIERIRKRTTEEFATTTELREDRQSKSEAGA
jgi:uncharacterized protein with PIN domain